MKFQSKLKTELKLKEIIVTKKALGEKNVKNMIKNFLKGKSFIPVERLNLVIILLKIFLMKILKKTTFFPERKHQQRKAEKKGSNLP